MNELENWIEKNRLEFSNELPEEGHFERFRNKLENSKIKTRPWILNYKIAASLFFGILITSLTYLMFLHKETNDLYAGIDTDLKETIYYYNSLNASMEDEIAAIEFESETEKRILMKDIEQYDNGLKNLLNDLYEYPEDNRITNAIIQHLRRKTEFLEIILNQVKFQQF